MQNSQFYFHFIFKAILLSWKARAMHVNDRFHDNVAHLLFSYNLYGHGLKGKTSGGTLFTA